MKPKIYIKLIIYHFNITTTKNLKSIIKVEISGN